MSRMERRRRWVLLAAAAGAVALARGAAPVRAQGANDAGYTAKIKEYTTEPFFLTDLVDHLPASDRVPTPEKVLGYVVGTPEKLTYTKDLYRYFRELEKATPRVRVFTAPERSEEGREQLLVLVSDEANLAKLDRYKEITAKLADPRRVTDDEALTLIREAKPFYWASGSIHSSETGSPEMLMELAYRLAVEDSPLVRSVRQNVITMITPALEVDGRDRTVDLYRYRKANPDKPSPPFLYWGKYVAHDNNRDNIGMALALSRNQIRTFLDYHPLVVHDLHESVPFLYTSTGTGPYSPALDPLTIDEWHMLAYHEINEMTKRGVPGIWTHGFYDGWAPNYMLFMANGHNAIGRFYETFGNGGADTQDRTIGPQAQRAWFRPNPPLARVRWSMRNNVNLQQSALLLALQYTAENRERLLHNFYLKGKRSIVKATNEGPAAYVLPGDDPRPVEAAGLVNLLRLNGVEVHRTTKKWEHESLKLPAGSYVVRMDQPYSRYADTLLDTQYFNVADPTPYDDTGWTLGATRNVKTVRVTDKAVLDAPMELLKADASVRGRIEGSGKAGYVINHTTENTLATLRFRLKDVKIDVAEAAFKRGDDTFNAGSFIIQPVGNPEDLPERLEAAVTELGLVAHAVGRVPEVKTHPIGVPRIALVHTWVNTQDEGWYRIELDRLQIPYSYVSDHVLRDTPNLRSRFDVILFPPAVGSAQALLNGIPLHNDPIPWKGSDEYPNLRMSPDQTDDIRGGLGIQGLANLQRFVQEGGLFIGVDDTARLPVDFAMAPGVSIIRPQNLKAQGSIYNASFTDRGSPIAYGYGDSLPVYFSDGPLFQAAAFAGAPGAFGGGAGVPGSTGPNRPSGRGTMTDPDIVQAMPRARPGSPDDAARRAVESEAEQRRSPFFTPAHLRPRIVLRFVTDEKNLLVSGMLSGGSELAGRPAVVDAPVGKGHVVLFANNPMWRHQTQGSFFLLFNAALNWDHLDAGRPTPPALPTLPRAARPARGGE